MNAYSIVIIRKFAFRILLEELVNVNLHYQTHTVLVARE